MKNILLTAILAILGTGALAQTTQGTVSFSGSLDVSSGQGLASDANAVLPSAGLNISPGVGYFIANQLELGISASVSSASQKNDNITSDREVRNSASSFYYSLGPYLRKYFMLTDKVALHGTADLYYEALKQKSASFTKYTPPDGASLITEENKASSRSFGLGLSISPGISYFPSDKFGLGASFGSLGYTRRNYKNERDAPDTKSDAISLNLNASSFALNFSYYLSR